MFLPEYSITPDILKNISLIEYSRAVIENTTILPSWENQISKETKLIFMQSNLKKLNVNTELTQVKAWFDRVTDNEPMEFQDLMSADKYLDKVYSGNDLTEANIKEIAKILNHRTGYRDLNINGGPKPEEILAKTVQFFDWTQTLDGKETHPVILASISRMYFEYLKPFRKNNTVISSFIFIGFLKHRGYSFKNLFCLENYFDQTSSEYKSHISKTSGENIDYTAWIEYVTNGMAQELSNLKERIKILARDTKIAKATGRAKFTPRQERIVEYLQDYGILQNKDFARIFPDTSEDSVLRDLKVLIQKGIIQKSGSTKSSLYELS